MILPWLGLGISSNSNARDRPHPFRIPGFDFIEYSAPIAFEEAMRRASLFPEMIASKVPLLFHPVELNLYGPELESATKLERLNDHLRQVRAPWVSNDVAWWHAGGQLWPGYQYLAPPFTTQGIADCTSHALHVQSALDVPLLLENPAVIAKRGDRHVLDFMAELHRRTGCLLLLDLGHLLSYQLTAGLSHETGIDGFPLEAVAEIHIAGGMIASRGERRFYFDAHAEPIPEALFDLLASIAPRCPALRAVTYEADGHSEEDAARNLARLRALVQARSTEISHEIRRDDVEARPPLSAEPWSLARAAYVAPDVFDPEGAEVEREYRLAIAAQIVDPFTPELANAFVQSPEFLAAFERGVLLHDCFAAWVRARHLRS